jgi:hypothetical protein
MATVALAVVLWVAGAPAALAQSTIALEDPSPGSRLTLDLGKFSFKTTASQFRLSTSDLPDGW